MAGCVYIDCIADIAESLDTCLYCTATYHASCAISAKCTYLSSKNGTLCLVCHNCTNKTSIQAIIGVCESETKNSTFSDDQIGEFFTAIRPRLTESINNCIRQSIVSILNPAIDAAIRSGLDLQLAPIRDDITSNRTRIEKVEDHMQDIESRFETLKTSVESRSVTSASSSVSPVHKGHGNVDDIARELADRKWRASNIILFNVEESSGSDSVTRENSDTNTALNVLRQIRQFSPATIRTQRIGPFNVNKRRPLRVRLPSAEDAVYILKNKNIGHMGKSIKADLTQAQRDHFKRLCLEVEKLQKRGLSRKIIHINGIPRIVSDRRGRSSDGNKENLASDRTTALSEDGDFPRSQLSQSSSQQLVEIHQTQGGSVYQPHSKRKRLGRPPGTGNKKQRVNTSSKNATISTPQIVR